MAAEVAQEHRGSHIRRGMGTEAAIIEAFETVN